MKLIKLVNQVNPVNLAVNFLENLIQVENIVFGQMKLSEGDLGPVLLLLLLLLLKYQFYYFYYKKGS